MKSKKIFKEVWIGLCLTLLSIYLLFEIRNIPAVPARYPRVILIVLLALSAALTIQSIWFSIRPEKAAGKTSAPVPLSETTFPLAVFGLLVVYLALFHFTNFFIATAIFVPVMMLLYGQRKVLPILLVTVGLELFVYLVFMKLLNVYFPM